MTPAEFVKYADGMLLVLMFGFLLITAIGLALEAMVAWLRARIIVQLVLVRWRAWRGRDPADKDHA